VEHFYTYGGAQNPNFNYKIKVKEITNEMHVWCMNYDHQGRWAITYWNSKPCTIQFEYDEPAIMFALKFGAV
jgi:hypothetical protein